MQIEWGHPYWLLGGLAVLSLLLLALRIRLSTGRTPFASPTKGSWLGAYWPSLTVASALFLGCIAAAEPTLLLPAQRKLACPDFWLIWDISRSMRTPDTPPERRFFALKLFRQFLDSLERYGLHPKIGLIAFAAQPYAILPLTADWEALRMALEQTVRQDLGEGTNLSAALEGALGFTEAHSTWLIVSDGGHNISFSTSLSAVAEAVSQKKITIHTLLVGKEASQFQPEALQLLSQKTGGVFQHNQLHIAPLLRELPIALRIELAPWLLLGACLIGLLGIVAMGVLGWFNVLVG